MDESQKQRVDGTALIDLDPWLEPYEEALRERFAHYRKVRRLIDEQGGLLGPMTQGHRYFGFTREVRDGQPGIWYREWAPAAHRLALIGDFNGWDHRANELERDEWGVWHLFLPDESYAGRLVHESRVKVHVDSVIGGLDRIPAYIRRVVQEEPSWSYTGQFWDPPEPYRWWHPKPKRPGGLRVYEAHIGMAQEEGKIGTFTEFTQNVLPRIADLGYNAVQLMAVMEHPYYASFGYHVSNFYAVSSRFGTPEELKVLIDEAHRLGLLVIMDLVHSHAVKNIYEGLNRFDGTQYQYFHAGERGEHTAWDSLCFDYSKPEVLRFLLSNVRFWLEEYHFDGFRFDGVTSMLYLDHGLGRDFIHYDDYFGENVDLDALAYLMLANEVAHGVDPGVITIAEDMSGMVGIARPVPEGGIGFDYRLAMGIPDYWIKLLKECKDEEWPLGEIYHMLLNRRTQEKNIAYAESHDQALVGDKTIAFWLMDQEQYWNMNVFAQSPVVDRGVALHKMIRLITFALGGEGYLNFMGNEFGHPEWIDFPRPGNHYSYHYARRQWSLVDQEDLRYVGLQRFDQAMQRLDIAYGLLEDPFIEKLLIDEERRLLIFRRGSLVFAMNFHPTRSYDSLRIPVPDPEDYQLLLDTDSSSFAGHGRVAEQVRYPMQPVATADRAQSIEIYLPTRTAQVLVPLSLISRDGIAV